MGNWVLVFWFVVLCVARVPFRCSVDNYFAPVEFDCSSAARRNVGGHWLSWRLFPDGQYVNLGGEIAFTLMLAIKACLISLVLGFVASGTGIFDIVFGPQIFIPGICTTVNLYRRVCSCILSTLGFLILSRSRLLNIGTKGLWSTAMINL